MANEEIHKLAEKHCKGESPAMYKILECARRWGQGTPWDIWP